MRKTTLLLIACLLLMGALLSHTASAKKGVNADDDPGPAGAAMTALDARWYHTRASGRRGIRSGAEFVPMIWGAGNVTDAELNTAKANGRQLLGFNEPDMAGQANMTVERALDLWPRLQNTGLRLGAPGVAFGGDVAGGWLDRFTAGRRRATSASTSSRSTGRLAFRPCRPPEPAADGVHHRVDPDARRTVLRGAVLVVHPVHEDQSHGAFHRHRVDGGGQRLPVRPGRAEVVSAHAASTSVR